MMKKFKPTLTLSDIEWLVNSLKREFPTKEEFEKYTTQVLKKLDKFVGDIEDKREEQTLHDNDHQRIDQRLNRVEKHLNLPV